MANVDKDYEVDYAYLKKDTSEFGSVHVSLEIGNEALNLIIESDEEIKTEDFEVLLLGLQKNQLKKLRLNIKDDCKCIFVCHDVSQLITLDYNDDSVKILSITPIEE